MPLHKMDSFDDIDTDVLDYLGLNTLNKPVVPTQDWSDDNQNYAIENDPNTPESLRVWNNNDLQCHQTMLQTNGGVEYMEETTPTDFSTEERIKYVNNCIQEVRTSNAGLSSEEKIYRLSKLAEPKLKSSINMD